ncbi:hypothetical protein LTS12_029292, partial [Elasticomyces elasticus]
LQQSCVVTSKVTRCTEEPRRYSSSRSRIERWTSGLATHVATGPRPIRLLRPFDPIP